MKTLKTLTLLEHTLWAQEILRRLLGIKASIITHALPYTLMLQALWQHYSLTFTFEKEPTAESVKCYYPPRNRTFRSTHINFSAFLGLLCNSTDKQHQTAVSSEEPDNWAMHQLAQLLTRTSPDGMSPFGWKEIQPYTYISLPLTEMAYERPRLKVWRDRQTNLWNYAFLLEQGRRLSKPTSNYSSSPVPKAAAETKIAAETYAILQGYFPPSPNPHLPFCWKSTWSPQGDHVGQLYTYQGRGPFFHLDFQTFPTFPTSHNQPQAEFPVAILNEEGEPLPVAYRYPWA